MTTNQITKLSDEDWLNATAQAVNNERASTAHVLHLLIEVDGRQLYLGRGYASMFAYCTRALCYSEQAAYDRIAAARAARRFPQILEALGSGDLTLSAVTRLAPHLADETGPELIEDAVGKSTRDIERMIANLHRAPDVPSSVRMLPARERTVAAARTTAMRRRCSLAETGRWRRIRGAEGELAARRVGCRYPIDAKRRRRPDCYPSPMPIHVIARHWARPETVEEVRTVLLSLIGPSRAEAGCLKYELLQNADDPADFTFVETFASEAALERHAAAPYIAGLAPRLKELVARPAEVCRYRAIAAPGAGDEAGRLGRRGDSG